MNWMLIAIFLYSTGVTSVQVGPYASHGDCEKAAVFLEKHSAYRCVPVPAGYGDKAIEFPPEFD